MNIVYDVFFKRYGVRLPQHLMTPVVATLDKFEFPKNSIYHYYNPETGQYGPLITDYYLREITKQILIDHVLEIGDFKGSPRKINQVLTPYIREYSLKHRRFRYSKDMILTPRDENTLMILNYGFTTKLYRYVRSMFSSYYEWWNNQKTIWKNVNIAIKNTQRQQFVFVDLPKILPSVTSLDTNSDTFNANTIKFFDTPESLFILELWKWLGQEHRDESVFSDIELTNLHKVNIVYKESNSWILLNLGVLNDWRYIAKKDKTPEQDLDSHQKIKISPRELQKRFLRLLMTLMSVRAMPIDPDEELETQEKELLQTTDEHKLDEESHLEKAERLLSNMNKDLAELTVIENRTVLANTELKEASKDRNAKSVGAIDFHKEETADGAIIAACDKLADDGLLTAATYRSLVTSAKNYQTIVAPDGVSTLENFIKITPEDLAINESSSIPDIPTVLDKSMLKSSLISFDQNYIKNVLSKDVAGMVVNIQKAGVILSNYTVEKRTDIMGDSEHHVLKLRPVDGVSSSLKFDLPTVDDEGVVTYNGNRYMLRKQRGD